MNVRYLCLLILTLLAVPALGIYTHSRLQVSDLAMKTTDSTPPVTTTNLTQTWFNHDVTVALIAVDDDSGVNATYYRIDGGDWIKGNIVVIPAPLNHSNDGLHTLEYYSIDNAGNVEEPRIASIGIDTVEPNITCSLANRTYFSGGSVNIYFYVNDNMSGLKEAFAYIDGALQRTYMLDGNPSLTIDLLGLLVGYMGEGEHTIRVDAKDLAGNNASYLWVFYVDKSPPTAELIAPAEGSIVSGNLTVVFHYEDTLSPVIAYLTVGSDQINVTGLYNYTLDTTIYPDGRLTIVLEAFDMVEHSASDSVNVTVDNNPPNITIISPINGSVVSGVVKVKFNITDRLLNSSILIIGDIIKDIVNATSYLIDTTQFPDGPLTLRFQAKDLAGHVSQYNLTLIIDNHPPVIRKMTLPNQTVFSQGDLIRLNWSIDEKNIEKIILYIDGDSVNVTGMTEYIINTTSLNPGNHTITLLVVDKAGRNDSRTLHFSIAQQSITTTTSTSSTEAEGESQAPITSHSSTVPSTTGRAGETEVEKPEETPTSIVAAVLLAVIVISVVLGMKSIKR